MTSSIASTTVSGVFLRICMWLYGAGSNARSSSAVSARHSEQQSLTLAAATA
jgi:hypothetical protein